MSVLYIYFRFIQFSLGLYEGREFMDGSALVGFDWKKFYDFARKQTLLGIIMDGIVRLPKVTAPKPGVLMPWFVLSRKINSLNGIMNDATVQIYDKIKHEGFSCCVLKGQGNALMYPNPNSRTSGDIDVWVNASRDDIRSLAHRLVEQNGKVLDESLNHVVLSADNVVVELHSMPCFMANSLYNSRLQKWLNDNVDRQCGNLVAFPDTDSKVAVPTTEFNVIYQLYHIYHHYFYEGIGLRQIIDYYFVIKKLHEDNFSSKNLRLLQRKIKYLGLWKFAGALMFVLNECMNLSEDKHIVPMDVKRGKMLLDDILAGGNFGFHYNRKKIGCRFIDHNLQRLLRDARLVAYYPSEAFCEPFFRMWHYLWRKNIKLFVTA